MMVVHWLHRMYDRLLVPSSTAVTLHGISLLSIHEILLRVPRFYGPSGPRFRAGG